MLRLLPAAVAVILLASPVRAADPPADAVQVLIELRQQAAAVEKKALADIFAQREKAVERLKALQDKYTKAGALDDALAVRELIRTLTPPPPAPPPPEESYRGDPGNLRRYRGHASPLYFEVTGALVGNVWGTEEYTDDSTLAVAAVHAGVLQPGETAVVKVILTPSRSEYWGTTRHKVTTSSYMEQYGGGYRVEAGPGAGKKDKGPDPQSRRPTPGGGR